MLSSATSHCHPERSEAPAERSRRTPCSLTSPPARKEILCTDSKGSPATNDQRLEPMLAPAIPPHEITKAAVRRLTPHAPLPHLLRSQPVQRRRLHPQHRQIQINLPAMMRLMLDHRPQPLPAGNGSAVGGC